MSTQTNVAANTNEHWPSEPSKEREAPKKPENLKEGESAGTAEQATIDEPKSVDELEAYFNRISTVEGERVAAQKALEHAVRMAGKNADRAMHLLSNSEETVNGALRRIGSELAAGADAKDSFKQIQFEMDRLLGEARERFNALKVESANNNDGFAQSEEAKAA